MAPNHKPIIYFSVKKPYVAISVDTAEYEYVLTKSTDESTYQSSQLDASNSPPSRYTQRTSSTYVVSPSSVLATSFTSSSKIPNTAASMQECVKNMRSESACYMSVHTKPAASSDENNLQYSCNDDPVLGYNIPIVSLNKYIYFRTACQLNLTKELLKKSMENNIKCDFSGEM